MWEQFEAGCRKLDVTITKEAGKIYGIELSGNCVIGLKEGGAAAEGGELCVRDVVVRPPRRLPPPPLASPPSPPPRRL